MPGATIEEIVAQVRGAASEHVELLAPNRTRALQSLAGCELLKQATVDAIGQLQEIGVTWTSVPAPPTRSLTEYLENLQWAAEEIIPAFRS